MLKNHKPANTGNLFPNDIATGNTTVFGEPAVEGEIDIGGGVTCVMPKNAPAQPQSLNSGGAQNYMYNLFQARKHQKAAKRTWRKKAKSMKRKNTRVKK
jgi:hypothetical protein